MVKLIARAVIPLNDTFLVVRNQGASYWCLPGGNVDKDESITAALEREITEELGVQPKLGRLLYVYQLFRGDEQRVEFFFLVDNPEAFESVDIAATTHGAAELADAGFYTLRQVEVRPEFLAQELQGILEQPGVGVQFRISR